MKRSILEQNRLAVLGRIAAACERAGRDPASVRLVAVTKTVEPEVAAELVRLGTRDLGENRASELERKRAWFAEHGVEARWHFIGHVQRNKARRVVRLADEIASVDSLRLLSALGRLGVEEGRRPPLWLQVHLSGEASKHGLEPGELPAALELARREGLAVRGLMTMAPLAGADEPERTARPVFERLAGLARALPPDAFVGPRAELSMGMSGDFEVAIAAGADEVRVGSALFVAGGSRAGGAGARR